MRKFLASLLSVLLLVGCHKAEEKHSHSESADDVPSYKEGKGIFIGTLTKESIGLSTVAVSEKKFVPGFATEVQVYQTANKATDAFAAGFISPEHAGKLKTAQSVKLKAARNSQEMTGKLVRLDAQTRNSTGQIEAIVAIPDSEKKLSHGDFLEATFLIGEARTSIIIPRSALLESTEGDFVYVENGEHFMRSAVKLGETFDDSLEILEGLYEGDIVVVNGLQSLWLAELRFIKGGGHSH